MTAAILFRDLITRGVSFAVDGDRLIIDAPAGALRPDELNALRATKAELLSLLQESPATPPEDARGKGEGDAIPVAASPLSLPLRRCGALVCQSCHAHKSDGHRRDCPFPSATFEPCGSRWFWLSHYRAIKCCACEAPATLDLVEGWVLAREEDGQPIEPEILALLHVAGPLQ